MLNKESFNKAAAFIRNNGRALETALLEYEFYDGEKDAVLSELKKYQNADGGFGNALEPDFRAAASSVLCTTYAMDIICGLDTPSDNEMLVSAADYLSSEMDSEKLIWRFLPEIEDNYPRAPWWAQENLEVTFNNFIENPRVKICAYGLKYPELFAPATINDLLTGILKHLETRPDEASVDELLCYLMLEESDNLTAEAGAVIHEKLCKMIPASVETDKDKWAEYCIKPLQVIKTPDSEYRSLIADSVKENLDYELKAQTENGSWLPNWNWAGLFPAEWETAKREWSGVLTLGKMKLLRAYG